MNENETKCRLRISFHLRLSSGLMWNLDSPDQLSEPRRERGDYELRKGEYNPHIVCNPMQGQR